MSLPQIERRTFGTHHIIHFESRPDGRAYYLTAWNPAYEGLMGNCEALDVDAILLILYAGGRFIGKIMGEGRKPERE
jgi:hypothetical protein